MSVFDQPKVQSAMYANACSSDDVICYHSSDRKGGGEEEKGGGEKERISVTVNLWSQVLFCDWRHRSSTNGWLWVRINKTDTVTATSHP